MNRGDLEKLPTAELDALLHKELDKEDLNSELILTISNILEGRESNIPIPDDEHVQKAWEKYQFSHQSIPIKRRPIRPWIHKAVAVAAILCIVIFCAPAAISAGNIDELIGYWSNNIFKFFDPTHTPPTTSEYNYETDHPGLQQIYDAVLEMGVEKPALFTQLDQAYELAELKKSTSPNECLVTGVLYKQDSCISVIIRNIGEGICEYPKDEEVMVREVNGMQCYVFTNEDCWIAVWSRGGTEYSIAIDTNINDLYTIIDSVYTEE